MDSFECKDIKKSFGGVKALQGASIKLEAGEIRALFGGNGSGKSTLAKILGGVVKPDEGEIFIDGRKVSIKSPFDAKKNGIIVTFQELSLFYNLTINFNIMASVLPIKSKFFIDRRSLLNRSNEIIKNLNLSDIASKRVSDLSDNKKFLVEFAKSLVQNPKLLIVDEITSALFSQDFQIVKKIIFNLSENGIPIIFISHRMSEVYEICKAVTVMRNGKTIDTFNLKDIGKEDLLKVMVGTNGGNQDENFVKKTFMVSAENKNLLEDNLKEKDIKKRKFIFFNNLSIPSYNVKIDIKASPGEFIGISGLQGQGQSDLVRSAFGLQGQVKFKFDNKEILIKSPIDAIKNNIAYISGNREREGSFSKRSIFENLNVVKFYVLNKGPVNHKEIIKKYGLVVGDIRQPISTLSGGNQQKTIISRWLSIKPGILLADDLNKGVDVQARKDIHLIIKLLIDEGSTVLMVSSDDEELVDISKIINDTKVLIMYKGQIVKILAGKDISVANIVSYSLGKGHN